ncbi:hypothetical protein GJ496_000910 [Pomphorhynchus laevis]|nr:hypothetical protein GJ496_000910 [Pomphorhynchus laevis]
MDIPQPIVINNKIETKSNRIITTLRSLAILILLVSEIVFICGITSKNLFKVQESYKHGHESDTIYNTINLFQQCTNNIESSQISCVPFTTIPYYFYTSIQLFSIQVVFVFCTCIYQTILIFFQLYAEEHTSAYIDIFIGFAVFLFHLITVWYIVVAFNSHLQCFMPLQGFNLLYGGTLASFVSYFIIIFIGMLPYGNKLISDDLTKYKTQQLDQQTYYHPQAVNYDTSYSSNLKYPISQFCTGPIMPSNFRTFGNNFQIMDNGLQQNAIDWTSNNIVNPMM